MNTKATPLPQFRHDLHVYRGPEADDGSPTYNIYDPLRSIYFKITWREMVILKEHHGKMSARELVDKVREKSTLDVTEEQVTVFFNQLLYQGLLEVHPSAEKIEQHAQKMKANPIKWFALNYLFFKIPLVNPNRFLEKTLFLVKPFLSLQAMIIYCFILFTGIFLVITQWNEFVSTFTYFFNFQGIVAYVLAILGTKVIHEFSHAYTAKKYGLTIPKMGIAFLVLFPVLFTDATDAWRLHDRRRRLIISAAGVISELVLAGIATIGWSFSQPGILQSIFFVVASANWISTLFINLNPALRFDGYYLLSDWWGVENLQNRAFAVARCDSYYALFKAELPDPEPLIEGWARKRLVIYSYYTWIYRIFLYTAIALFVYYKFTKALGVFLFLLEIAIFFVWPIMSELDTFLKVRHKIYWTRRLKVISTIIVLILGWLILPLPHSIFFPAITIPVNKQVLYSPSNGMIVELNVERGDKVSSGETIVVVRSRELDKQLALLQEEQQILQKQLDIIQENPEALHLHMETSIKQAKNVAELEGLKELKNSLKIISEFDGVVYQWDENLRIGQYVTINQVFGEIGATDELDVMCFVSEENLKFIEVGKTVTFRDDVMNSFPGLITQISPVRELILTHPQLASIHEGDLPVVDDKMFMLESYYPVKVRLIEKGNLPIGETGYVKYTHAWYSLLISGIRTVYNTLLRESNL